jgi:hypothetical protein
MICLHNRPQMANATGLTQFRRIVKGVSAMRKQRRESITNSLKNSSSLAWRRFWRTRMAHKRLEHRRLEVTGAKRLEHKAT